MPRLAATRGSLVAPGNPERDSYASGPRQTIDGGVDFKHSSGGRQWDDPGSPGVFRWTYVRAGERKLLIGPGPGVSGQTGLGNAACYQI